MAGGCPGQERRPGVQMSLTVSPTVPMLLLS